MFIYTSSQVDHCIENNKLSSRDTFRTISDTKAGPCDEEMGEAFYSVARDCVKKTHSHRISISVVCTCLCMVSEDVFRCHHALAGSYQVGRIIGLVSKACLDNYLYGYLSLPNS